MPDDAIIILHTAKWINDVVVGCNFCPFAAREIKRGSVYYEVLSSATLKSSLEALLKMFQKLDNDTAIETIFLITPGAFVSFDQYLLLVELSEKLLKKERYDGIYQVASFHPDYLFAGTKNDDAANYTNRSPYPMLHILREESVSRAIASHPGTGNIPQKNIEFARAKGLAYMQSLKNNTTL